MKLYLKVVDVFEIGTIVSALISIGSIDIHIIDNTHLDGGSWEIEFINYHLTHTNQTTSEEQKAWDEVMRKMNNG